MASATAKLHVEKLYKPHALCSTNSMLYKPHKPQYALQTTATNCYRFTSFCAFYFSLFYPTAVKVVSDNFSINEYNDDNDDEIFAVLL